MKKIITILTILILALPLAACSANQAASVTISGTTTDSSSTASTSVTTAAATAPPEGDPLDAVKKLMAAGVPKKEALAQIAKANKIPKRELYNRLLRENPEAE